LQCRLLAATPIQVVFCYAVIYINDKEIRLPIAFDIQRTVHRSPHPVVATILHGRKLSNHEAHHLTRLAAAAAVAKSDLPLSVRWPTVSRVIPGLEVDEVIAACDARLA